MSGIGLHLRYGTPKTMANTYREERGERSIDPKPSLHPHSWPHIRITHHTCRHTHAHPHTHIHTPNFTGVEIQIEVKRKDRKEQQIINLSDLSRPAFICVPAVSTEDLLSSTEGTQGNECFSIYHMLQDAKSTSSI